MSLPPKRPPAVSSTGRTIPPTHAAGYPEPGEVYVVRDRDWEMVWGANLTYEEAHALKEKIAGRRLSKTVQIELMPTEPELLRVISEYGYEVDLPEEAPAPVAVAPSPSQTPVHRHPAAAPRSPAPPAPARPIRTPTRPAPVAAAVAVAAQAAQAANVRATRPAPPPVVLAPLPDLTPEQLAAAELEADALEDAPLDDIING